MKLKSKMALWVFSLSAILLAPGSVLAQQEIELSASSITVEGLEIGDDVTRTITISNIGDADLNWSVALEDVYGRGLSTSFEKANFANWLVPENQDRISNFVWIARKDNQSIFNAKSETSADDNSPAATEWALGGINDDPSFSTFRTMHGNDPSSLVGQVTTLHDINDGAYYEVEFSNWSGGNTGGGFAYDRYLMSEYLSFESGTTFGTISSGGLSVDIGVNINTSFLAPGTYTANLVVTSNDTDEEIINVPISVEVLEPATFELSATSFTESLTTGDESTTQTFTISNNGESVLSWSFNSFDRPDEMSGVSVSPTSGTIDPGMNTEVTITFDDANNNEGSYEWTPFFSSNVPDNEIVEIFIGLDITGEAFIDYSTPVFNTTFVGSTSSGTLVLFNEGTSVLDVSGITSTASQFLPSSTSLSIAPGDSEDVTILFTPDASGTVNADLTITSNDASSPLVLSISGEAIDAPAIEISQFSFNQSLSADDEPITNSFTIANTGDGTLEWSYTIDQLLTLNPSTETTFAKASGADETLEPNQDRITSNVWITRTSNDGVFNAFEEGSYSGSTNTIEWALGRTEDVSAEDYTEFKDALNYNVGGQVTEVILSLHLIEEDRYFDVEFDDWESGQGGGAFSYTRTEVTGWISTDVSADPIAASGSANFEFDIDASAIAEGNYEGIILITSNDPLAAEQQVTVNISVTGTPDISTTETAASVENTPVGAVTSFFVPIINSGSGNLAVSNVVSTNGVFSPAETSFVVPGLSTHELELSFSPALVQSYSGDLTISSDDPSNPSYVISLTGDGVAAGTFGVSSMLIEETLAAGETSIDQSFTISNTGAGQLEWEIAGVRFEKGDWVDDNLPENQDRIKDDIRLTRGTSGGIYNESDGNDRWIGGNIFGQFGETADYSGNFLSAADNCGSCVEGNFIGLYLPDYEEYYDLFFESWTSGNGNGNGGGGGFAYIRRDAVPWLGIDSYGESLESAGMSTVNVSFDASELNAGTYSFTYDIVSNDPANPTTTVTFNLEVTGTPDVSVSEGSEFAFGNEFIDNTSNEGLLEIRNTGTATLNVSDIQFDNAAFSATTTSASVEPGEYATFELTFTPSAEQEYSAIGTITSNEDGGTSTFEVSGTGVPVPSISIDVSEIDAELLSGGLIEKSFTVTNIGTSGADWSIDRIMVTGTDEVLFEKADYADWTLPENQDRVSGNLWITRADEQGLFNAALETGYTGGERERDLRLAIVIEIPTLDPFDASPHGTLWASGPRYEGNTFTRWRSTFDGASGLPGNTLSMWDVVEDVYYDIKFLSWTSGICCGNTRGGGVSYLRYETVSWLNDFSSSAGTVDEAEQEVTFNIDANGVSAGEYTATIVISDGINTHDIDVTLTVLGLPEISVSEDALDFESVFVGDESIKTLEISNNGLADLEIASIVSNDPAFTVVSSPSAIGIDDFAEVEIMFAPTEAVNYSGTLTITSNDGTSSTLTVDLSGIGQTPPVVNVNVTSLDETLFFGASSSQTFTISNTGDADLEWNLGVSGGTVEMTKADFADWTLAENQDRITDNVWLTRADRRGLFNAAQEEEYDRDSRISPVGTLWRRGATGEEPEGEGEEICCFLERVVQGPTEDYSDWNDAINGCPTCYLDEPFSLYLEENNAYYDVVFTSWTSGNEGDINGGGFSYTRTAVFYEYEAVSFSATEGVVAPGQSQNVTVFFNPTGTFEGQFELPLQVQSNDPSGPVDIPISLNVNGIIVENPLEDQLENEGFVSSAFDISNMFADAQDDPLNYIVESTDGAVASAVESGGTLTVNEVGFGTTTISITAEDGKGSSDTFEFEFRVNAFPVSTTSIPDQTEDVGFGAITLDVASSFSDPDGDELSYSASSDNTGVVTVSMDGSVLTITEVAAGNTIINVTADDGFGAQLTALVMVTVNKLNQTITFGALANVSEDVGTVALTATASSELSVTYESSNTSVATVSGSTLTIVGDGQTTITASQAGDAVYNAATPVSQSLIVEAVLSAAGLETVEFYPNPTQDFLTIRNSDVSLIEIYHLDGKLVMSQEVSEKADLTTLEGGIYLVKLKDANDAELYSGRLVKN